MASTACILIRRKLFDEIAGFDGNLPFGYEDVEICCGAPGPTAGPWFTFQTLFVGIASADRRNQKPPDYSVFVAY